MGDPGAGESKEKGLKIYVTRDDQLQKAPNSGVPDDNLERNMSANKYEK